jgi:hypothetical protein
VITETLVGRALLPRGRISDSTLKSCYYYPVCRCQRTSQASVGPAGRSDFRNLFRHSNSKRSLFAFGPPRTGPHGNHANRGSHFFPLHLFYPMVGVTGLEPVTLRLSSACSNQLSYTPVGWFENPRPAWRRPWRVASPAMEAWGFEPQTYSLQSYRSTN